MKRLKGIDVSEWQVDFDYEKVSRDYSLDFVILREGRGTDQDEMFLAHLKGFRSLKVPIKAVYHFIYALTDAGAKANAESCIYNVEKAGLSKSTYIWCDFEYDTVRYALRKGVALGPAECDRFTRIFCETIRKAGYPTGIYLNQDYYNTMYEPETLAEYPIWLCDIDGNPEPKHPCMVWQYSWKKYDQDYWFFEDEETKNTEDSKTELAVQWMENLARDDSHGYDQARRWGPDYDCSSAVISAWKSVGIPLSCTYTGDMKADMMKNGFKDVTSSVNLQTGSGLVRGDVLLNEVHHTAMYVGNRMEVEASINEKRTVTGGKTGDQTGMEISIRPYRNYPWDCVLRYGNEDSAPKLQTSFLLPEIQKGDTGNAVSILQSILKSMGYKGADGLPLVLDGDFGPNTDHALVSYQRAVGLDDDGIAGTQTWTKLKSSLII